MNMTIGVLLGWFGLLAVVLWLERRGKTERWSEGVTVFEPCPDCHTGAATWYHSTRNRRKLVCDACGREHRVVVRLGGLHTQTRVR